MKYRDILVRNGRIRQICNLHLKSAVGYTRSLKGRIELDLLRAAI